MIQNGKVGRNEHLIQQSRHLNKETSQPTIVLYFRRNQEQPAIIFHIYSSTSLKILLAPLLQCIIIPQDKTKLIWSGPWEAVN